ncbi:MAG: hypothetical protein Q9191_007780 [Dirinaria sp. TL-2023a]
MVQNSTASSIIVGEYNAQCSIPEVESATAMLNLWGNLLAGILGAITAPLWGKFSDNYGRVKPLVAASTVLLASEVIIVLLAKLPDAIPLNWIYLAFFLEGLSERNVALGWFHGSMFFGFAAGPALGGYIGMAGGQNGPMLIFYAGLVMRVAGIMFLLIFVPESLPGDLGSKPSLTKNIDRSSRGVSRQTWMEMAKTANPIHIFSSKSITQPSVRQNIIALASVNTIMFGAFAGAMNIIILYAEYTFDWGNKESGTFLSTINIFRTLATTIILPLAVRFFRQFFHPPTSRSKREPDSFSHLDLFLLRIAILSDVLGYIGYALSPTGTLFTLSGALSGLGAIGLATSEASMTKLVDSAQTGELLGALGFLQAMARIVAPTLANLTYSLTVAKVPALVLWGVAAGFSAAGFATFWIDPGSRRDEGVKEEVVPLQEIHL